MFVQNKEFVIAILVSLLGLSVGGCCRDGGVEEVPMSLVPSEVAADQEVVVLAQFEEDVFLNGRVDVRDIQVSIEDARGSEVGRLYYLEAMFDYEEDRLEVDGVILDGTVVDSTTFELVLAFDQSTSMGAFTIEVSVFDGGVECFAIDSGTATLTVQ